MAILKTIFAGPDKPKIPALKPAAEVAPQLGALTPSGKKRRSIATSPQGLVGPSGQLKIRLGG